VIGKLCAANSYYHEDKFPEAEARYQEIISNGNIWVRHAEYNLAVTYLKMGRTDEAKALLKEISDNEEHDFQKKAKELLKEVEAL
jgi:FimV-like protein